MDAGLIIQFSVTRLIPIAHSLIQARAVNPLQNNCLNPQEMMLQTKRGCPTETKLVDYLLGRLPEISIGELESHLQSCNRCEETIRSLSASDTLNQHVGDAVSNGQASVNDQKFVANLIEQLQSEVSSESAGRTDLRQRATEVLVRLASTDDPESIGQLGDYLIDELIGAGSTGVVFRATDRQLGRKVALKVLRPSLGAAAHQRFMAEARAAASIEHPAVVTIYQVGETDGLALIAMQWLPGETLEARLARVTFIPEDRVGQLASQVAAGLDAAHAKMLIHRDIKPANIWLCEESEQAIILDFGLARVADDDPQLTATGMLAGTPNFMSPEQTRGQELDGRSDLFSLGCVMYQAATGKLPFGAGGVLATLQSIQHDTPASPQEVNPNLSDDFSDLVMCLLDKQPPNRPGNAGELVGALQRPRKRWPFNPPSYPQAANSTQAQPRTNPEAAKSLSWFRWLAAGLAALLLAFGWWAFGQQIIRIVNNEGEIIIETDDPDVLVEISSGNEVVSVIDTSTSNRVDIKAGEYQISARDPVEDESEFRVSQDRVVLDRGGRQIVSITMLEKQVAALSKTDLKVESQKPIQFDTKPEPTYEGRTFAEWLDELSRERSRSAIATGISALRELSRGDKQRQQQAVDALTPLIRIHGSKVTNGNQDWPDIFNSFFSYLPPEMVVDFVIRELKEGTKASRSQCVWMTILGTLYQGDSEKIIAHQATIRRDLGRIFDAGSEAITNSTDPSESGTIRSVINLAVNSALKAFTDSPTNNASKKFERETIEYLQQQLKAANNIEIRGLLVMLVMEYSEEVPTEFFELLADHSLPTELTGKLYFDHLLKLDSEEFARAVEPLLNIYKDDRLVQRLLDFVEALQVHTLGGGGFVNTALTPLKADIDRRRLRLNGSGGRGDRGGRGAGDLGGIGAMGGDEIEGSGSGSNRLTIIGGLHDGGSGYSLLPKLSPLNQVRANILFRLGDRYKAASVALPWLEKLAASDSPLNVNAAIAATKIRGRDATQTHNTWVKAAGLIKASEIFQARVGRFPDSLTELVELPAGMSADKWQGPYVEEKALTDSWRNRFRLDLDPESNSVRILSAGIDRKFGSRFDLRILVPPPGEKEAEDSAVN